MKKNHQVLGDLIARLQRWYQSQGDEDWEHTYGVRIETLDNPGWLATIDLSETEWSNKASARNHVQIT